MTRGFSHYMVHYTTAIVYALSTSQENTLWIWRTDTGQTPMTLGNTNTHHMPVTLHAPSLMSQINHCHFIQPYIMWSINYQLTIIYYFFFLKSNSTQNCTCSDIQMKLLALHRALLMKKQKEKTPCFNLTEQMHSFWTIALFCAC